MLCGAESGERSEPQPPLAEGEKSRAAGPLCKTTLPERQKNPSPEATKKTLFKMPAAQAKKQNQQRKNSPEIFCFLKQTENVILLLLRKKRSWA